MRHSSILWVAALMLLSFDLSAQVSATTKRLSVLRCSDLEILEFNHSFGYQNLESQVSYISPSGDTFIVGTVDSYNADRLFANNYYNYYKSASGEVFRTEEERSKLDFVATDEGVLSMGREIYVTNHSTGEPLWFHKRFRDTPFYIHQGTLLALGGGRGRFYGYDLKTGAELWEVKIGHEGGVSDIFPMDDEHVLIVADDLVKLNTRTGELRKYEINNYILNGKMIAGQILAGVAGGVMAATTGVGFYTIYTPVKDLGNGALRRIYGEANAIASLSSNVCSDGNRYYLADRDSLRCFDGDLNLQWATPLPPKHGSQSSLMVSGDTLRLVNYGIAYVQGAIQSNTGYPFVASFDARIGEQLSLRVVGKKHAPVQQVHSFLDHATYLFDDSCKTVYFDHPDETETLANKKFRSLKLLEDPVWMLDSITHQFRFLNETKPYLVDMNYNIFQCEGNDLSAVAANSSFYTVQGMFADSLCVIQGGPNRTDCWLIDEQGVPVYHILQPVNGVEIGTDYLFIFYRDGFFVLDREALNPTAKTESSENI